VIGVDENETALDSVSIENVGFEHRASPVAIA
jgi:hypothetical protein